LGVAFYGISRGNIGKLLAPYDGAKRFCNYDEKTYGYKKLYDAELYANPLGYFNGDSSTLFTKAVCAEACPKANKPINYVSLTEEHPEITSESDSTDLFNYCLPKLSANESAELKLIVIDKIFSDPNLSGFMNMYNSSRAIYSGVALAFVYSLLYIYMMSYFAEYIAWGLVIALQTGFILLTIFFSLASQSLIP